MTAIEFLNYLQNDIHTTVAATVDDNGLPVTCAIDMMDADDNGLYFLTARGKGFYNRLKKSGLIYQKSPLSVLPLLLAVWRKREKVT